MASVLFLRGLIMGFMYPCFSFCSYIKGLDYDPDRERAQLKKLKKHLKSERKGAVRELRKDNYYLTAAKEKDRIKHEQERTEKYGKAMAFLQEQESAFKSGQLGKGKKRRW
jgi:nucleolar protein 14